jgi:hypothetical protein
VSQCLPFAVLGWSSAVCAIVRLGHILVQATARYARPSIPVLLAGLRHCLAFHSPQSLRGTWNTSRQSVPCINTGSGCIHHPVRPFTPPSSSHPRNFVIAGAAGQVSPARFVLMLTPVLAAGSQVSTRPLARPAFWRDAGIDRACSAECCQL